MIINEKVIKVFYQERWRDWPYEAWQQLASSARIVPNPAGNFLIDKSMRGASISIKLESIKLFLYLKVENSFYFFM